MKINRLETHDRLEHLIEDQSASIEKGASDCLKKNSLSLALQERSPYIYIFAHPRTMEDGVTKKMFWQPRLSKPKAQSNSYLFRAQSKTDILEVVWILPDESHWGQHKKGNVTESDYVTWSINQYKTNKKELEKPFPDDFKEDQIRHILRDIAREMEQDIKMKKMYIKPETSVVYPSSYLS